MCATNFIKKVYGMWMMIQRINQYALTIRKWQAKIRAYIDLRNQRRAYLYNGIIFEFRKYKNELNVSGNDDLISKQLEFMNWKTIEEFCDLFVKRCIKVGTEADMMYKTGWKDKTLRKWWRHKKSLSKKIS